MLIAILLSAQVFAAEGMWLPSQVRAEQLESMGFQIGTGDISRPGGPVLGPVVSMGHCTASFVSEDGLLITNGHCVRSYLQYASDEDHDRVQEGFIAPDIAGEAWAGPAARIFIPEETRDVTAEVQDNLKAAKSDAARHQELRRIRSSIAGACEAMGGVRCEVVGHYGGGEWELVKYREIQDIRLVYAPPDDVVFFGGEVDNWMWPRHVGDMALFRAYVGPDNQPAAHAEGNQPYRPEEWLKVSTGDLDPGDPVLIAGFPASTSRYKTSGEIKHAALVRYPEGIELFTELIRIMREHAITSDTAASKLGPMIFNLSNQRINYKGMLDNMNRDDLVQLKKEEEARLDAWIDADRKRKKRYAKDIAELRALIVEQQHFQPRDRLIQLMVRYPSELRAARTAYRLALEREKDPHDRRPGFQERDEQRIADRFAQMDRTLYLPAEEEALEVILERYAALEADQRIPELDAWITQNGGLDAVLGQLFASSRIADPSYRERLLKGTAQDFHSSGQDDIWVQFAVILEGWEDSRQDERDRIAGAMERLRPIYMKARMEMADGPTYPDANGTLRVSIGQIAGYEPQEAVSYAPQTTVRGMLAKVGPPPFSLGADVQDAIRRIGESPWSDPELGTVPLNFLSSLDHTGGHSGSPTLNGTGELIGLAFDRNYEAMAADWAFDHHITRSLHVDLRFNWWLMSEVQDAGHILAELGIEPAAE